MESQLFERNVQLLEAELGEELVALDVAGGHCFGFNGVATTVCRLLDQPRSQTEIEQALVAEYDVDREQCATELQALLADLVAKGLVRTAPVSAS